MKTKVSIDSLQFKLSKVKHDNTNGLKSFGGVAYSGLPILNHPYWGNLIFDLTTVSSDEKIPVLFNHDPNKIVGHGKLSFDGNISIEGTFSDVTIYGKEISGLIAEGFPMKESVYIEPKKIKKISKGKKFNINGQDLIGPFTVFIDSTIKEVSMTPLPADSNTSTHLFSDRLKQEINIEEILDGIESIKENEKTKKEDMTKDKEEIKEVKIDEVENKKEIDVVEVANEAIKELTNEEKFFSLVESKDLEAAFKFACECEGSKKEPKLDTFEEKYNKLKKKFDALVSKISKDSKFSKIKEFSKSSGVIFSDEAAESLTLVDDAALDLIFSGMKITGSKIVSPELFRESEIKEVDLDLSSSKSIQDQAKKFQKSQKEKGIEMKGHEAVLAVLKMNQ